jgi:hypothetical protein
VGGALVLANTKRGMRINPDALRRMGIDPDAPLGMGNRNSFGRMQVFR